MVTSSGSLDAVFTALGDPTRRAILEGLATGERTVSEVAAPFGMSRPAISKHLRVLERAGLVLRQRDGRVSRCTLAVESLAPALEWLTDKRLFWQGGLDRLAAHLATGERHAPPVKPIFPEEAQ